MCICHENVRCPCYRSAREYREERARQAHASVLEHLVFAVLCDEDADVSPRATEFAMLVMADPASGNGANVADILVAGRACYWWTLDGMQHFAQLRAAVRLAA